MKKAIIATKVGMTQIFSDKGILIPVTVLEAGPCTVIQKKTVEKDGYDAVQLGFKDVKLKHVTKPVKGHFDAAGQTPLKILKEFRLEDISAYEPGSVIDVSIFAPGDRIDASGISKGKGYQGNIKRHGKGRGPMSHGSKYHRGVGALSAGTSPGRVMKGRKLPGQMGNKNVTVQNLEVVKCDAEKNLLLIKGAVPGPRGSVLFIKDSVKQ